MSRAASIKFDPQRSLGPSSVKFDLLLNWLDMNSLVGEMRLGFYQVV
jgi:hypothetical protein